MPYAGRHQNRDNAGRFVRRLQAEAQAQQQARPQAQSTWATTATTSEILTAAGLNPGRLRQPSMPTVPPPTAQPVQCCDRSDCGFMSTSRGNFTQDHYGNVVCLSCAEDEEHYFICESCDDLYPADNYCEDGCCYGCCENQDEDEFYCDGCDTTFQSGDVLVRECPANYGGDLNLLCDDCYRGLIPLSVRQIHEMRHNNRVHPRPSIPMAERGLPRTYPENAKDVRSRILIRCPFGIEIETTNGGNKSLEIQSLTGFSGITDGSIHTQSVGGGLEFVSPVFLDDSGLKQIEKLCGLGLTVNDSCGLHMHLDSRDWDWQMLRKFMTLVKMVEHEVMEIMPPRRYNGGFCSLLKYDADEILDCETKHEFLAVMLNLNSAQFDMYMKQKGNKIYALGRETVVMGGTNISRRYEWVNVMSYFYRGSVELRVHEGTTNYETIKNWVLLWQAVVHWLKTHTLADLESISSLWDIPNDKIVSFYEERRKRLCADYLAQSASTTSES